LIIVLNKSILLPILYIDVKIIKGVTMNKKINFFIILVAVSIAIAISGCSDKKTTNPLGNFSPEIINNPDAFEFQISDAENVTTVVTYSWENSGTTASIDQSCAITAGTAVITVFDADSVQVYTSDLSVGGSYPTDAGNAGTWTITVGFQAVSGTVNFRVETM
jgi:hypothetical protein